MTLGSHQRSIGKSQVHITPRFIIDALGPFDLDPCAADPRPWNCAKHNYTAADNGLVRSWDGSVYLNPPFDRREVGKWIAKLALHNDGIALLHARTETAWFRPIWQYASAILFLGNRVTFCKPDGTPCTTDKGEPANSGAPVVLCAFGPLAKLRLQGCGLPGALVTDWNYRAPRAIIPPHVQPTASHQAEPHSSQPGENHGCP